MAIALDPPPTVNHLGRRERMRLVQSNRKLETVLGAAPYYLEDAHTSHFDTPKVSRRGGRVFDHSPVSPSSTFDSKAGKSLHLNPLRFAPKPKQGPRTLELSRPLLLCLRSVPGSPSDNRASRSSSRCPSLASASSLSPTFAVELQKLQAGSMQNRRKKMAKLTRTLGENIPPELVFPSISNVIEKHFKSRSLEEMPTPPFGTQRPVISRPRAMTTRSRPKIPPAPSKPAPVPVVHVHLPPRQASQSKPTLAERRRKPRPRSLSVSTGTDMLVAAAAARARLQAQPMKNRETVAAPVVQTEVVTIKTSSNAYPESQYLIMDERATKDIFEFHSPLPFQSVQTESPGSGQSHAKSASASSSPLKHSVDSSTASTAFCQSGKRKELGWSGEWNQDMENVVKNLRSLKAR
ncbi:hypothetical protein C0993_001327 [Termitomyces sp. T159_Od127]|nr:hypothetical protein C0993_001327 [Termitomyces sp. T159_Od127]